eukprot:Skav208672  [mRNA]  locus=scaffold775:103530:104114:+ [translate_table: standard]
MRQVSSHFYLLIGPYDSGDPDVLEYHLLLMLCAGVDGVLIDWYGSHGKVNDYSENLENSEALTRKMDSMGMKFGIVYEDYVCEHVAHQKQLSQIQVAQEDMAYMESKYFSSPLYLRVKEKPLLLTFGPRLFRQEHQWHSILSVLRENVSFLPLWQRHREVVGYRNSDGEFSWVDFDPIARNWKNSISINPRIPC